MGAQTFVDTVMAISPSEAYSKLVDHAINTHGRDPYNGTISTCELGKCVMSFDVYKESNKTKAFQKIEQLEGGDKWEANYIDLGVKSYVLVGCEKSNYKNTPKFKLGYCVYNGSQYIGFFETKKEAEEKAIKTTLENLSTCTIRKEYKKIDGVDLVEKISPIYEELKTRPKTIKKGSTLIESHEYVFFGWASC